MEGEAVTRRAAAEKRALPQRAAARVRRASVLARRWAVAAFAAAAVGAQAQNGNGDGVRRVEVKEIAPFRLTGVEGYVLGGYWRDSDGTSGPGSDSSTTLSNITGKAFLMTHSYVYHPNFLLLDLGAGPVLFRNSYSSNSLEGHDSNSTYDAIARATFLSDKPYNGSLFYERRNDSQPIGPAQSLLTKQTDYGFNAKVLAPATPVGLLVDAHRYSQLGRGISQVVDEQIDEANFRAERAWGRTGYTNFRYHGLADDSKSGSTTLPIQPTESRTDEFSLDTRLEFGEGARHTLTNTVFYQMLEFASAGSTLVDQSLLRFDLSLESRPKDTLQTRLRYQYDGLDQKATGTAQAQSGHLNAFNAGATWQATPDLGFTADAPVSFSRSTVFDADQYGFNGTVNYVYRLPVGELVPFYALSILKRDQTAKEPVAQVIGESIVLAGLAWVPLRRERVVPGSVVVLNAARTQTFIEGLDYQLRVIGETTEIQRLPAGAILDGQQVLVDYRFETGGTYATTEVSNTLDLTWRYKQLASVYWRYTDYSQRLDSGAPTFTLNPATERVYGGRVDVPFGLLGEQMLAGAFVEWRDRNEVISPYEASLYEGYIESTVPLIPRSGLRFGALQRRTNYDLTPLQDVTERTMTLRFWSRFRNGISVYLEGTETEDSGSPLVAREYRNTSATAEWRIRRLLLSLRYAATTQRQSGVEAKHSRVQFDMRRDF